MELRQSVLQDVVSLLHDDKAVLDLQKYLQHLKKRLAVTDAPPCRYTPEEMKEQLLLAAEAQAQGQCTSHEEVLNEVKAWW